MIRRTTNARGSALLLVIGVSTILFMVGAVFMMVTWADNTQAKAVSQAAPMRTVAEGQLERVLDQLVADLRIGSSGPYSNVAGILNEDLWKVAIDYPSAQPDHGYSGGSGGTWIGFDEYLASHTRLDGRRCNLGGTEYVTPFYWPKLTNLGEFTTDQVRNVPSNGANMVDTNGDRYGDALLFATGVKDPTGREYYAAVRVIDLSGLMNINCAYQMNTVTSAQPWASPALISPEAISDDWYNNFPMDGLHANIAALARTPDNPDWATYTDEYVRRAGNPAFATPTGGMYRPFDFADEVAFLWRENDHSSDPPPSTAYAGRVAAAVGDPAYWRIFRDYLTTRSASRIFVPPTVTTGSGSDWEVEYGIKAPLNPTDAQLNPGAAKLGLLNQYRRAFYNMIPTGISDPSGLSPTNADRARTACQMAVNLIDYLDGDDTPTQLQVISPGSGFVYGIERQPFVTQAWYRVEYAQDPNGLPGEVIVDSKHMAVVLTNPYVDSIELGGWELVLGGATTVTIPAGTVINGTGAGDNRLVLRSGADINVNAALAGTLTVPELDPTLGVALYRPTEYADQGGPGQRALVGRFEADDFDPTVASNAAAATPGQVFLCDMGREDRAAEFQLSVDTGWQQIGDPAAFSDYTQAGVEMGGSTGITNSVPPTPIFIRGYGGNHAKMASAAEIDRIFYVGPTAGTTPLGERTLDEVLGATAPSVYHNGRLNLQTYFASSTGEGHPLVPPICRAADYFVADSPLTDGIDNDGDGVTDPYNSPGSDEWNRELVLWGRINANTMPDAVNASLPGAPVNTSTGVVTAAVGVRLNDYRDQTGLGGDTNRINNWLFSDEASSSTLRNGPGQSGFASIGEAGLVARQWYSSGDTWARAYVGGGGGAWRLGPNGTDDGHAGLTGDLTKYDTRYAYLGNVLTLSSDVYAVYIHVQLGDGASNGLSTEDIQRKYVAVVDRSNVYRANDRPVVLMFAEIK